MTSVTVGLIIARRLVAEGTRDEGTATVAKYRTVSIVTENLKARVARDFDDNMI